MKKDHLNEYMELIKEEEIFEHGDIFQDVLEWINIEIFKPGERIIAFEKDIEKVFYMVKGKAKINMVHQDGKNSIVQFLRRGDFMGELSLIGIERQIKDVVSISECTCFSLSMDIAREKLLRNERFLLLLNRYLGEKLLKRTEYMAQNQNYELRNRLAAYILLTENEGIYKEKQTETAEFLGVSYRHLLHTIKKFKDEKLIVKIKGGYRIKREELELIAKDIYS